MTAYEQVLTFLEELGISVELVEHEPAFTTEEADSYIEGIEGVRTKTMFLTNKKKTQYYLLIMDDNKLLDMDKFRELVGANRIRMASPESLMAKMRLSPGTVSPFGLLNNAERDIRVYFDQEIMSEERMSFHPNTNDKTVFIKTRDLLRFLEELGFDSHIIGLS